jgi:hypothetical protein
MMLEKMNPGAPASAARVRGHDADRPSDITPNAISLELVAAALVRVITRRVPWPSLKERPDRAGLRLRWDALHEETGELLAAGTEHPLPDAAHALAMRGLPRETLVTMRHEGSPHDSFVPMPLRIPAAAGARRAENRARIAALRSTGREETAMEEATNPEALAKTPAVPVSIPNELHESAEGRS